MHTCVQHQPTLYTHLTQISGQQQATSFQSQHLYIYFSLKWLDWLLFILRTWYVYKSALSVCFKKEYFQFNILRSVNNKVDVLWKLLGCCWSCDVWFGRGLVQPDSVVSFSSTSSWSWISVRALWMEPNCDCVIFDWRALCEEELFDSWLSPSEPRSSCCVDFTTKWLHFHAIEVIELTIE